MYALLVRMAALERSGVSAAKMIVPAETPFTKARFVLTADKKQCTDFAECAAAKAGSGKQGILHTLLRKGARVDVRVRRARRFAG
jgi:hypothetical protein